MILAAGIVAFCLGCSIGIVVGAVMASGPTEDEMQQHWQDGHDVGFMAGAASGRRPTRR